MRPTVVAAFVVALCMGAVGAAEATDAGVATASNSWAQWRGPLSTGVAPHGDPPTGWSETENIRWKIPLPGLGHGSPVVWGEIILVHCAVETDEVGRPPEAKPRPGRGMPMIKTNKVHEFVVLAVNRTDGSVL